MTKQKGKILGTAPSKEGITKLISDYYMGSTITVAEDGSISNSKGVIKGVRVVISRERHQFRKEE